MIDLKNTKQVVYLFYGIIIITIILSVFFILNGFSFSNSGSKLDNQNNRIYTYDEVNNKVYIDDYSSFDPEAFDEELEKIKDLYPDAEIVLDQPGALTGKPQSVIDEEEKAAQQRLEAEKKAKEQYEKDHPQGE